MQTPQWPKCVPYTINQPDSPQMPSLITLIVEVCPWQGTWGVLVVLDKLFITVPEHMLWSVVSESVPNMIRQDG